MASLVFSQLAETLDALRLSYANQNKFLINKEILPLKSRENHAGEQQLCNIFLSDKAAVTLLKEFRKHQTTSFSHAPNSNSPPPPRPLSSQGEMFVNNIVFSNEESSNFLHRDYSSTCLSKNCRRASKSNCSSFYSF